MATIGDGIKIGAGLLMFKMLLGFGACAVGVGTCAYLASRENPAKYEAAESGAVIAAAEPVRKVRNKRVRKARRAPASRPANMLRAMAHPEIAE
jgi:hypothetical protein